MRRWFIFGLAVVLPLLAMREGQAQTAPTTKAEWIKAAHAFVTARMKYPSSALLLAEGGRVVVAVEVARDGSVEGAELIEESATEVLNEAALAVFREATLPPFPADMAGQSIKLQVPLEFKPAPPREYWLLMARLILGNARVVPVDEAHYSVSGRAVVDVRVGRRGAFNARVKETSGHRVLDDAALAAVKSVELPPFPEEMTDEEVPIEVVFDFAPPATEIEWMSAVSELIQGRTRYPQAARAERLSGIVNVSFRVARDGTVSGVRLERGARELLDDAALALFAGLRLPPLPASMEHEPGRLYTSLHFGLPATEEEWERMSDKWVVDRARYPKAASRYSDEGTVEMMVVVSWTGQVLLAEMIASSGRPVLDQAALDLIRSTRLPPFSPDMDGTTKVYLQSMRYDLRTPMGMPF